MVKFNSELKRVVLFTRAFIDAVAKAKPTGTKGSYMKGITLSSTMGPGVTVNIDKSVG